MSPSAPLDNRFLALRAAAQDATDFAMKDDAVRRFIELCDDGAGQPEIAAALGVEPQLVEELVKADERQALAHRIATGELPMYPAPEPHEQVIDTRVGSSLVPLWVLVVVLAGLVVYVLATR